MSYPDFPVEAIAALCEALKENKDHVAALREAAHQLEAGNQAAQGAEDATTAAGSPAAETSQAAQGAEDVGASRSSGASWRKPGSPEGILLTELIDLLRQQQEVEVNEAPTKKVRMDMKGKGKGKSEWARNEEAQDL